MVILIEMIVPSIFNAVNETKKLFALSSYLPALLSSNFSIFPLKFIA